LSAVSGGIGGETYEEQDSMVKSFDNKWEGGYFKKFDDSGINFL
jgi:hypothetical protein